MEREREEKQLRDETDEPREESLRDLEADERAEDVGGGARKAGSTPLEY